MEIRELDLHITNKCNLRCRHCVFSSGERLLSEMNLKEISGLLEEFSKIALHKGTVNLFGGEVLLRKDIFDIIKKAKAEGLSVGITTNCHIPKKIIGKLIKTGINRLTSDLDGALPETHDWLRKMEGNFKEVVATLKRFIAEGIFTTVNSVLHKDNICQVISILELCKIIGVDGLAFYYLTPTGRGVNLADKIIDSNKWLETKNIVLNWIKKNSPNFKIYWEEAFENINDNSTVPWRCEKEHSETIFVRCDGEVYSCALLECAPISLGNIIKEKLGKVLERRGDKSFLRSNGCPALAFNKYKDLSKQDPRECSESARLGCPYNCQILNEK